MKKLSLTTALIALLSANQVEAKTISKSCEKALALLSSSKWENCISSRKISGQPIQEERLADYSFTKQNTFMLGGSGAAFFSFRFSNHGGFQSSINFIGHNGSKIYCQNDELVYSRMPAIQTHIKLAEKYLLIRTKLPPAQAELSITCGPRSIKNQE